MIKLKDKYREKDLVSMQKVKDLYSFTNKESSYTVYDAPYWLFGELPETIPDDYYTDPNSMMQHQLKMIEKHYETKEFADDSYMGFLMPWFGTGVLASGFGTKVEMLPKMDPAVNMSEIKDPEEIDALKMPDPYKDGLMPTVLKQIDYFRENCDLPIGVTDCQGPLTTALSIIGYENYSYWMYDYPDVIHKLMGMVTDALIDWIKVQKKHMGKEYNEPAYVLGMRIDESAGSVWISDDDSVIMPSDLFAEFVKPYNEKVMLAFDGGAIHYCGSSNQNIDSYMNTKGLNCIHNLNLDQLDCAKKIRKACLDNGKVYYLGDFTPDTNRIADYYDEVFKEFPQQGMAVVSYVAPAISLMKGKYEADSRNKAKLGVIVQQIIEEKQKKYIVKA